MRVEVVGLELGLDGSEVNLGFFWLWLELGSGLVLWLLLGLGLGLNWGCHLFLTCSAQPPHPL